jgi:hypothetical protein
MLLVKQLENKYQPLYDIYLIIEFYHKIEIVSKEKFL